MTATPTKIRLDQLLVDRGLFDSRSRARDAIQRGTVSAGGAVFTKPGQSVRDDIDLAVSDPARSYVSRAALKLAHALDHFGFNVTGAEALDIGASTGGFTQVLLERGAAHVTAIDVGHGQLHETIAADPRVTSIEGVNARDLDATVLAGREPDLVVCDVSFISLKLALGPALDLARPGARCVLLIKPQFELGRSAIGKAGIVRDLEQGIRIGEELSAWLDGLPGWRAIGLQPSPIAGGDGNREYLLAGIKDRTGTTR